MHVILRNDILKLILLNKKLYIPKHPVNDKLASVKGIVLHHYL